ncbi:MAG: hypothetical protein ACLGI2_15340 [Acidimicrobiia bacterium]
MTEDTRPGGGEDWEQDILTELAEAGRLEAVPVESVAAAKSIFAWRTLDAELAALTYDSDVAEDAGAGLRSTGTTAGPRALTFEAARLTVEVEVVEGDGDRRLLGQLVPPQAGTVEVRQFAGTTTVEADEVGRFTVTGLASGPVSLRCEGRGGGGAVVTDWFLV